MSAARWFVAGAAWTLAAELLVYRRMVGGVLQGRRTQVKPLRVVVHARTNEWDAAMRRLSTELAWHQRRQWQR